MDLILNNKFENKILLGLKECNIDIDKLNNIGIAVSGGADSVCLLLSISNILKFFNIPIKVVTVNHYIRNDEETCGDVKFVQDLCDKLKKDGCNVSCYVYELEKGEVIRYAKENKSGIEEAARVFRYKCFESFIDNQKIDYLCLAHNKNDQLETVLMRFLQGSFSEGLSGIPLIRGKYIRPMLDISRKDIEEYLFEKNQNFRTDKTNFDNKYLRNKIRNVLIPVLNDNFENWGQAVTNLSEKAEIDNQIINYNVDKFNIILESEKVEINRNDFSEIPDGIKYRVLLKAFNLLGEASRIPYSFLKDVINTEQNYVKNKIIKNYNKTYGNYDIDFNSKVIFVKKKEKDLTECFFSDIIEYDCCISIPAGEIHIYRSENKITIEYNNSIKELNLSYPFRIRSFYSGDVINNAQGNPKKIVDIFSDWHIEENKRNMIPVIEEFSMEGNKIVCILGSILGFKDWVTK